MGALGVKTIATWLTLIPDIHFETADQLADTEVIQNVILQLFPELRVTLPPAPTLNACVTALYELLSLSVPSEVTEFITTLERKEDTTVCVEFWAHLVVLFLEAGVLSTDVLANVATEDYTKPDVSLLPHRGLVLSSPRDCANYFPESIRLVSGQTGQCDPEETPRYIYDPNQQISGTRILFEELNNRRPHMSRETVQQLMKENLTLTLETVNLRNQYVGATAEVVQLKTELEAQKQDLQKLTAKLNEKNDEEFDMASELFQLKSQASLGRLEPATVPDEAPPPLVKSTATQTFDYAKRMPLEAAMELRQLRDDCSTFLNRAETAEQEVKSLKTTNQHLEQKLTEAERLCAQHEAQLKLQEAFIAAKDTTIERLQQDLQKKHVEDLLQRNAALEETVDILRERDSETTLKNHAVEKLEEEIRGLTQRLLDAEMRASDASNAVDQTSYLQERAISAAQKKCEELEVALDLAKSEIEHLKKHIELVETDRRRLDELQESLATNHRSTAERLAETVGKLHDLENKYRAAQTEIHTLTKEKEAEIAKALEMRKELEGRYLPEAEGLRIELRAAVHGNERLRADLELKELLIAEREDTLQRLKTSLEDAQRKLTESEERMAESQQRLSRQAQKAAATEQELNLREQKIEELELKVSHYKKATDTLRKECQAAKEAYYNLKQLCQHIDSERVVRGDAWRRVESDLVFYRTEFERLTNSTSFGIHQGATEDTLRRTLDVLVSQISTAKEELQMLTQSVETRIRNLPLSVNRSTKEFEVVDIMEHFEKEKAKLEAQLRQRIVELADAKLEYQALSRDHQLLIRSHAKTLRELMELRTTTASFVLPSQDHSKRLSHDAGLERLETLEQGSSSIATSDETVLKSTSGSALISIESVTTGSNPLLSQTEVELGSYNGSNPASSGSNAAPSGSNPTTSGSNPASNGSVSQLGAILVSSEQRMSVTGSQITSTAETSEDSRGSRRHLPSLCGNSESPSSGISETFANTEHAEKQTNEDSEATSSTTRSTQRNEGLFQPSTVLLAHQQLRQTENRKQPKDHEILSIMADPGAIVPSTTPTQSTLRPALKASEDLVVVDNGASSSKRPSVSGGGNANRVTSKTTPSFLRHLPARLPESKVDDSLSGKRLLSRSLDGPHREVNASRSASLSMQRARPPSRPRRPQPEGTGGFF